MFWSLLWSHLQWHWKQARAALFGPGMQKIPAQTATGRRYDLKVVVGLVEAALDNFGVVARADFGVPKLDSTPQQGSKAPGKLPTDAWGVHGAPKVGHLACRAAPNSTPRLFGALLLGLQGSLCWAMRFFRSSLKGALCRAADRAETRAWQRSAASDRTPNHHASAAAVPALSLYNVRYTVIRD